MRRTSCAPSKSRSLATRSTSRRCRSRSCAPGAPSPAHLRRIRFLQGALARRPPRAVAAAPAVQALVSRGCLSALCCARLAAAEHQAPSEAQTDRQPAPVASRRALSASMMTALSCSTSAACLATTPSASRTRLPACSAWRRRRALRAHGCSHQLAELLHKAYMHLAAATCWRDVYIEC